jgi:dihydrofolate reductase
MRISIIVAMDQNGGIGIENRLPWHLPADLRRFKALTMGHHLIMGRNTYESIGQPLPGRNTIVLSHNPVYHPEGCLKALSLAQAFEIAKTNGDHEVFICGGATVYREALEATDRIYLTRLHTKFQTDTSFPEWDPSNWEELSIETHEADETHPYPFSFIIYEKSTLCP